MATIKYFHELDCWNEAKGIFIDANTLVNLEGIKHQFYLKDQLLRASLSISNNIAEGFERGGKKEFRRYLIIANGSAAEVKSMLLLLLEVENGVPDRQIKKLIGRIDQCMKMMKGLIRYLNKGLTPKHEKT